ncbi:MAG: AzlC family ABC transporter permease, partial [Propionibacteriaceae bacterium]|nr:AzlC family ABC transporter permease [Propionibacteriaceae bacterium]
MSQRVLTAGVRTGLWVGLATGLYGISFGALATVAGLDIPQTCALSLLMFTGGSQFAFIGVLSGGGSGLAAWSAASLLGIRNGVYGMQLKALLSPPGRLTPVMAQLTIDESMAVSTAQTDPDERKRGFWAAGLAVFVFWNIATLVGALAGNVIGDVKSWGLDGAAVAAFSGLLWPHLTGRDPVAIAVLAAFFTIVAIPFVPPG